MGYLRYGGVEYTANDSVLETFRPVVARVIDEGGSLWASLFDGEAVARILVSPGVPLTLATDGSGTFAQDAAERWLADARAGRVIKLSCLDVLCDCPLRESSH
ncbi:hypothetical protein [Cellulomonas uda]|uniref:Uncharacterized protein n=1 Tax=Cellulomonas uda TaxID=1714 RepID=A0A4Y3K7H1_CELUD|nr:hypothetical protein [Cellulomonas uda]NII67790.1 hypothetical protein [Cellulomonas uda]GEA79963.1 hypothetical protein CUD01_04070 [Cellulomonas uda]